GFVTSTDPTRTEPVRGVRRWQAGRVQSGMEEVAGRPTGGPSLGERRYAERLWVPASWWAFALFMVASLWFAYAFALRATWVHGAGLMAIAVTVAALAAVGRFSIVVDQKGLTVNGERLPREAIGRVTALSSAQARALRGPGADATARLIVRPY